MERTAKLIATGAMVPFLDVNIGHPFFAHNRFWIRTSREAAAELGSSRSHTSVCNFTLDECDEIVEAVKVEFAE